jgi:hypothetical protein
LTVNGHALDVAVEELSRREVMLALDVRSRDIYVFDPVVLRHPEDSLTDLGTPNPVSPRSRLIDVVTWPTPRLSGLSS